jgi:aspartate aminotransferase
MNFSKKAMEVSPSITLEITAKAQNMKNEGIDVIGFGAGEPDFNTPINIQNAAIEAMKNGHTKYTPASGILELKKAIVQKLNKDNNLIYNENQIIVSNGAKQCLFNAFSAILNPLDEVLLPSPYWVSYTELIKLCGGIPVLVDCAEKDNFKLKIQNLEKSVTEKTKAIVLNSPNNPTGTVYTLNELKILSEFAKKHDIIIISDEIYEKLIYDNKVHISIASLSEDAYERTILINGLSKSYAMTGWRIGYAAGDAALIKIMSNLQSHITSNPNSIAQYASLEALQGDQESLSIMKKEFEKRRNYMVEKVNNIKDLSCVKPDGAFYIMVNISKVKGKNIKGECISDSLKFSKLLLREENVAVIPGIAFGADDYIRLSYATSMSIIMNGLERIDKFINKLS